MSYNKCFNKSVPLSDPLHSSTDCSWLQLPFISTIVGWDLFKEQKRTIDIIRRVISQSGTIGSGGPFSSTVCPILSHLVLSCLAIPILSHSVSSCLILSHPVTSCLILSHLVSYCPILSHPVPSCPILSLSHLNSLCLMLSHPVPSCLLTKDCWYLGHLNSFLFLLFPFWNVTKYLLFTVSKQV